MKMQPFKLFHMRVKTWLIYISNGDSIVNTPGNYWIEELSVSNEIFIDDTQRNGNRHTWIRVNGKYTYQ